MRKLFDILNLSIETIDFQSNSFGKELEMVFQNILDEKLNNKKLAKCEQKTTLESIIKKYTNLNIDIVLDSDQVACVYLPVVHRNHLFFHNHFRDFYEMKDTLEMFKKVKESQDKHTVNIKTSKVTGIFSEMKTEIHISVNVLKQIGMNGAEITAITLHEIGHLFTLFEYMNRQHSTNQVLAGVVRSVTNKDSIQTREMIFEQAGVLIGGNKDSLKELVNQEDLSIVSTIIFTKNIEFIKSELGTEAYDFTTCEQLADQYAARQGYGRELITALDCFSKAWNVTEASRIGSFYACFVDVVTFVGYISIGIFTLMINPLFASICAFLIFLRLWTAGSSNQDFTYDILKTRYLRIKEQLIQRLKDKNISSEENVLLIKDIKIIDSVISRTYEIHLPIDRLVDYMFSKDHSVKASIELQRKLESLAMNDFFLKSAELKAI